MRPPTHLAKGFTVVELLVVIAVIAILAGLAVPRVIVGPPRNGLISAVFRTHQIHVATMAMATDGFDNSDPSLGWPGDLKAKGRITTVGDFVNVLVRNDYLKPSDLKIFATAEIKPYPGGKLSSGSNGVLVPAFTEEYSAFKVYLVKDDNPSDTIFLVSKNYTYNTPLNNPNAKPFGDRGFVILRKGGDAYSLKKEQAQNLPQIGKLPGGGTVESAENCLNPDKSAPQRR